MGKGKPLCNQGLHRPGGGAFLPVFEAVVLSQSAGHACPAACPGGGGGGCEGGTGSPSHAAAEAGAAGHACPAGGGGGGFG